MWECGLEKQTRQSALHHSSQIFTVKGRYRQTRARLASAMIPSSVILRAISNLIAQNSKQR
jgi:hypothetical protein